MFHASIKPLSFPDFLLEVNELPSHLVLISFLITRAIGIDRSDLAASLCQVQLKMQVGWLAAWVV